MRCGGWGGECWARARLRGFSGVLPHMACDPRSHAHLKSPSVYAMHQECHASPASASQRPVTPCDPASGSRTGGARGGGGKGSRGGHCVRACKRGVSGLGLKVVCDRWRCAHLESPAGYRIRRECHASRISAPVVPPRHSIRPADRGPAVRVGWGGPRRHPAGTDHRFAHPRVAASTSRAWRRCSPYRR